MIHSWELFIRYNLNTETVYVSYAKSEMYSTTTSLRFLNVYYKELLTKLRSCSTYMHDV